jgi:phosphatidylserine/phosphatidylglycerophosphate/cardiolipin synthase-like enzyme
MSANPVIQGTTRPITGQDIALEFLQCMGYRYALQQAVIVTYTLQDYEFAGHGLLSTLLRHQLVLGADIILLTTPPLGGTGQNREFRRKLELLTTFSNDGIRVFVNENIHAKLYIFRDERDIETIIVGSANLTSKGFGQRHSPETNLLEIALITGNTGLYGAIMRIINDIFIGNTRTMDFATWSNFNIDRISQARGGL